MSIGIDIYGMFFPDNEVYKKHIYKGKLTANEKKKNYAYYFDKDGRLRLTERFTPGDGLANIIFYYYYKDYIDLSLIFLHYWVALGINTVLLCQSKCELPKSYNTDLSFLY